MEYGYVADTPKYNKKSGLYDVPVMFEEDIKIISCYRILNPTSIQYTTEPGYFLLSHDSKYIYLNNNTDINTVFKNIIFSKNNISYTNEDLLEINIDPVKKYTKISLIDIPPESCINLAFENNDFDKRYQIANNSLYNKYDCLATNVVTMKDNSFTNIDVKKTGLLETLSYYISGASTPSESNRSGNAECNVNIIEDVHQYNTFYVYSLTSLNLLFVIIIIIMIFNIVKDSEKMSQLNKKSDFD
jgi:hypothetical protein